MISKQAIEDCSKFFVAFHRREALIKALPILQDYADMLGFGEAHTAVLSAINDAQAAIDITDGCVGCATYHECHR